MKHKIVSHRAAKARIKATYPGRKVRADAKLEHLDTTQRKRLRGWFEAHCTYAEVVKRLKQEFGLNVGKSAVGVYWRRHMLPEPDREAEAGAALLALPARDFNAATLRRAWALAWSVLVRPIPEVDLAAKLLARVWRAEQHGLARKREALKERRVALREKLSAVGPRAAAAERRSVVRCEGPGIVAAVAPRGASETKNSPRFPAYSALVPPKAETGLGAAKGTNGFKTAGASAGIGGFREWAEVATKMPSSEGRSKGPDAVSSLVALATCTLAPREANSPRFPGYFEQLRFRPRASGGAELRAALAAERAA